MKKWLDDLYVILMKRGLNTLDNVLKKYKTEIEDYEEIKINDELIRLNVGESITIDVSNYYNIYDRFCIYNRGYMFKTNFMYCFYKFSSTLCDKYFSVSNSTLIDVTFTDNRNLVFTNNRDDNITFDLYVKKIC